MSPETIARRVAALRARAGLSMEEIAQAMGFRGASGYQRYEAAETYKGGFAPTKFVMRMETALVGRGTPPITRGEVWELAGPGFAAVPALDAGSDVQQANLVESTFSPGKRTMPVYAAAMGGDGHAIITFSPIEIIDRPAELLLVDDAYGVFIVGESMVPAYKPGQVAYVNPRLPPVHGEDVVLFHAPPAQEAECMIKQLNNWNGREWTLEQFNPPLVFTASRAEWPVCHRVVGRRNRI